MLFVVQVLNHQRTHQQVGERANVKVFVIWYRRKCLPFRRNRSCFLFINKHKNNSVVMLFSQVFVFILDKSHKQVVFREKTKTWVTFTYTWKIITNWNKWFLIDFNTCCSTTLWRWSLLLFLSSGTIFHFYLSTYIYI